MGPVAEIVMLAVAAAFWPVLLGAAIVGLRTPHPKMILASFLAGAFLAAVSVGLVIIYALDGSSLTDSSATAGPVAEIVVGALSLLAAAVLRHRDTTISPPSDVQVEPASPGRVEQALARGASIAFVTGIVLDLAPSPFALIAYKDIAGFDISFAETLVIVIAFYLVALMFVEVPLLGYLVAPGWTASHTVQFNTWLNGNWRRLAIWVLTGLGAYLICKGVVDLA